MRASVEGDITIAEEEEDEEAEAAVDKEGVLVEEVEKEDAPTRFLLLPENKITSRKAEL